MNLFDAFYSDRKQVLAEFLGLHENDLQTWSDSSFTLSSSDKKEYHVLNERSDEYAEYLGEKDGYHIYKN